MPGQFRAKQRYGEAWREQDGIEGQNSPEGTEASKR